MPRTAQGTDEVSEAAELAEGDRVLGDGLADGEGAFGDLDPALALLERRGVGGLGGCRFGAAGAVGESPLADCFVAVVEDGVGDALDEIHGVFDVLGQGFVVGSHGRGSFIVGADGQAGGGTREVDGFGDGGGEDGWGEGEGRKGDGEDGGVMHFDKWESLLDKVSDLEVLLELDGAEDAVACLPLGCCSSCLDFISFLYLLLPFLPSSSASSYLSPSSFAKLDSSWIAIERRPLA